MTCFVLRNAFRPNIKRFFNFRRITSAKIRFLIFGFSIAQRFNFQIGTTPVQGFRFIKFCKIKTLDEMLLNV